MSTREEQPGRVPPAAADTPSRIAWLSDPLLILLLERTVNTDLRLERLLLEARCELLIAAVDERLDELVVDGIGEFLSALAQQCFLNEYVYEETAEEAAMVQALLDRIEGDLTRRRRLDGGELALVATFRPLWRLPFAARILRYYEPAREDFLYKIIRLQLIGPTVEKLLAHEIEARTAVADPTSRAVRDQYEENPYPRWLYLDHHDARGLDEYLTAILPAWTPAHHLGVERPAVLIAGCGTGKQAISARMRIADSRVTAFDLSRASLAYASRMTRELGIDDIEYFQADILETRCWPERFDLIECVGVLHHMADPAAGWRLLTDLLAPGGVMRVGLYSRRARTAVALARDWVRAQGLAPDRTGVQAFRRHVASLAADDPVRGVLRAPDFFSTSECRDLVFHACERDFTLSEIAACMDQLELDFLGFELTSDEAFRAYAQAYPEDPSMLSLSNWDDLESAHPRLFGSMYQFWAVRRRP